MPSRDFLTMFPQIPKDALIVSQSTIQSLEFSPCRWLYRSDKRIASEPMFYGTCQHGVIEGYMAGRFNEWQLIDPNTAQTVMYELAEFEDFEIEEVMPTEERRAKFVLELAEGAQAWHRDWWQADDNQNMQIVSVEEPFAMDITPEWHHAVDRRVWFVTGGIDLLTRYKTTDWKTASVGWKKGYGSALSQKEAYAMLTRDKYGWYPSDFDFVVYNRVHKRWNVHEATVTDESIAAYRARVDGWVTYMLNPFHLCTPTDGKQRAWHSKPLYNDVWDRCPSCRHLGDGFDNKERKDATW